MSPSNSTIPNLESSLIGSMWGATVIPVGLPSLEQTNEFADVCGWMRQRGHL